MFMLNLRPRMIGCNKTSTSYPYRSEGIIFVNKRLNCTD